jgi:hypothetical protein
MFLKSTLLTTACLFAFTLAAQHEFMPLAYDYDVLYGGSIYKKEVDIHTAVRPLRRTDVYAQINVDSTLQALRWKGKFWNTWAGRALFSDHFIQVRTKDFDLSVDPLVDFRYGKERGSENDYQFHSTKGFYIQGRIGRQVTFMTSFTDNQARYPDYVQSFVQTTGVTPGQGQATSFNTTSWDFRNAFGLVSYTPSKYFNFELGQGRVFFGEGHRSTILSDAAMNYPYLKVETTVWKIKYVNLWSQNLDIRKPVEVNQANRKKWVAAHYLSYNVNSRLNISIFEAVVYGSDTNNRGIEASYFNPIIFFRPVEAANGSDAGNVLLGIGSSYKLTHGLMAYGQFTLDELVFGELLSEPGSWRNKYSYQLGLKYLNAFKVENLHFRLEYNATRPYMYQHIRPLTNYGHFNQPLAHPWGANFRELIAQAHYRYRRVVVDLQITSGKKGLDENGSNWGGNIYLPYDTREQDDNNTIAQGVTVNVLYVEGRLGYLLNPSYNIRLEGGAVLRRQSPENGAPAFTYDQGPYIYLGLRTALFNNYFDF